MIKYINLLLFAGMVTMNYLANALPINGKTTGELSDAYPNLFVPAGITFSIWGVIYLLLALFCVIQFIGRERGAVEATGWLFALSCLLNGLWIVAWHYERLPLSLLIMVGLLITLIAINISMRSEPWGITRAAFGIYLGWICIATIANVTALLVNLNWSGGILSEEVWAIIMIAAGAAITVAAVIRLNNPFVGLAVVWALAGIALKRSSDHRVILIAAIASLVIVALFSLKTVITKEST